MHKTRKKMFDCVTYISKNIITYIYFESSFAML